MPDAQTSNAISAAILTYNGAMTQQKPKRDGNAIIAQNRRVTHDYFIEQRLETGLALQGWEVKSLRDGKISLAESYIQIHQAEAYLYGAHITPLPTASTHIKPQPTRHRKLLLHRHQLDQLIGAVERKGYTLVPTFMYWKQGRAKLEIGLAKGKKAHDKRESLKTRDWNRDKQRLMKRG